MNSEPAVLPDTSVRWFGDAPGSELLNTAKHVDREQLRALRLDRLRVLLRRAYGNVGPYRRKFDEAGVTSDDCRALEDLARYPFTTKEDLCDNYPSACSPPPLQRPPATRLQRRHRPAGHGRLRRGRPVGMGGRGRLLHPGGRRAPGRKVHIAHR